MSCWSLILEHESCCKTDDIVWRKSHRFTGEWPELHSATHSASSHWSKDSVTISKIEEINLSRIANRVTEYSGYNYSFLDFKKTILNIAITFLKMYRASFVTAQTVDILKSTRHSDSLTWMSSQSHYRQIRVVKMSLKHKGFLRLVDTLNDDDDDLEKLEISHLHDVRFYTGNTKELPIFIRAGINFINTDQARFPSLPTFYASAMTFQVNLMSGLVDHRAAFGVDVVAFLNLYCPLLAQPAFLFCHFIQWPASAW